MEWAGRQARPGELTPRGSVFGGTAASFGVGEAAAAQAYAYSVLAGMAAAVVRLGCAAPLEAQAALRQALVEPAPPAPSGDNADDDWGLVLAAARHCGDASRAGRATPVRVVAARASLPGTNRQFAFEATGASGRSRLGSFEWIHPPACRDGGLSRHAADGARRRRGARRQRPARRGGLAGADHAGPDCAPPNRPGRRSSGSRCGWRERSHLTFLPRVTIPFPGALQPGDCRGGRPARRGGVLRGLGRARCRSRRAW